MPSKDRCDVLAELRERQKHKKFFKELDDNHLLFRDYVSQVMEHFNCNSKQAGILIGQHAAGEF